MTVARDAVLESSTFTTTTPFTFDFTPVGTPRGITVVIAHGGVFTDLITSVTYGGVTMTRIDDAVDTAGEDGRVYTYFLGASIPTGTQTVSIVHTGSADVKWACVQSVTAATDTEVVTFAALESGNQANPQIALDTGATSALRNSILYSGLSDPTLLTILSGMEAITTANTVDFGLFVALFGEQTTAAAGSFTIGYTASADDVAMVAVAIQEVAGGAVTGTIAVTQDDQTAALTGTVANPITGTVGVTQDAQTAAFSATETIPGTIATTQEDQTAAFAGTVANPVTGTVTATQDDQTAAFTGTVTVQITGTITATQDDQTAAFTGTVANPVTGTIAVTQSDQTMVASGQLTITGTITTTQEDQTATFTGTVASPVTGTIGVTQEDQTAAFVGFVGDITFWSKNPAAYTANPAAYTPVRAGDTPPSW